MTFESFQKRFDFNRTYCCKFQRGNLLMLMIKTYVYVQRLNLKTLRK